MNKNNNWIENINNNINHNLKLQKKLDFQLKKNINLDKSLITKHEINITNIRLQLEISPIDGIVLTILGIYNISPIPIKNFMPYIKVTYLPNISETFESNVILSTKTYENIIKIKFPNIELYNLLERSFLIQVLNYHKSSNQTIICENQISPLDFNWESSEIQDVSILLCPSLYINTKDIKKLKFRKLIGEYGIIVINAKYNLVREKLHINVIKCKNLNTTGYENFGIQCIISSINNNNKILQSFKTEIRNKAKSPFFNMIFIFNYKLCDFDKNSINISVILKNGPISKIIGFCKLQSQDIQTSNKQFYNLLLKYPLKWISTNLTLNLPPSISN